MWGVSTSEADCLDRGDCPIEDNDPSRPPGATGGLHSSGAPIFRFDDRPFILDTVTSKDLLNEARTLLDEIVRHARADDYRALLEIDADPRTKVLLEALPDRQSRPADVYLRGARSWRSRQSEKARRKLQAASKALDELDVVLARGILRKIDSDLLEQAELTRYDELLLAVEARALELEDIESGLPTLPNDEPPRRKRFWRG